MIYEDFWGYTVYELLARMAQRFDSQTMLTWKQDGAVYSVTYSEFFRTVGLLAARFEKMGLRGKYVVIDMRNSYEQVAALFAAVAMGSVVAPISFDLPLEDLKDLMNRIGPRALVCDEMDFELLPLLDLPGDCRLISCLEGTDSVARFLGEEHPLYCQAQDITPDDPALLLATSGSTSRSKLVLLSHYALAPHGEFLPSRRVLHVLPLYHVAGLGGLVAYMAQGSEICLSDLGRGLSDLTWFKPWDIFAVPSFVSLLVRQSRMGRLDLSSCRSISSGGAPQDLEAVRYLNSMGIFSMSLYGATETSGMVDYSVPDCYRFGSVGAVGPWNQIKISPQGEILVKGKTVMMGYLGDPEATAQAMEDGWYHTGDIGHLDEDGFLFVTGRIKNIIILSNGENVSPEAVESKLGQCPAIVEVVVRDHLTRRPQESSDGDRLGRKERMWVIVIL